MYKISAALFVGFVALGLLAATSALAEDVKLAGTITKVEGDLVTVKTADSQQEVMLTPSTTIVLDGKPAKSNDLKVGHKVKCAGDKQGDKVTCLSIEASSG